MANSRLNRLIAENAKLRKALSGIIPWAGESPDGPSWSTPEAKQRNRAMFERAMREACACFPDDYNGIQEIAESN